MLRPHLCEAIKALLQAHPQPPLPTSWARVRQVIRDMQERKTPRTVSQAEFQALCDSSGCGSNAAVLRTALHQMGVIFYREGVFDDLIIIDQSWVLDKVYTVFDRTRTNFLREVRDKHGRFRRSDLQRFFWQNDSVAEQQVYLGFMESCGICFRADEGSERDDGALYLAPDMLPEWDDGPREEYMGWPQKPDAGVTASFSVLHDGIARGFLSRIGRRTGMRADYWRFGCHFRDRATGSEVLIRTSGNAFRLEARGGAATEVLGILLDVLRRMPTRQPLTETWDARDTPPPAAHECTDGDPVDRLDPEPRSGLAGLFGGNRRMGDDDIGDIRSIYLMGCAFRVGAQSHDAELHLPDHAYRIARLYLGARHLSGSGEAGPGGVGGAEGERGLKRRV